MDYFIDILDGSTIVTLQQMVILDDIFCIVQSITQYKRLISRKINTKKLFFLAIKYIIIIHLNELHTALIYHE